jgi:hypothetical protein
MIHPFLIPALSENRLGELRSAAARDRLARIATCCRPSVLARRLATLRERLTVRTEVAACCS